MSLYYLQVCGRLSQMHLYTTIVEQISDSDISCRFSSLLINTLSSYNIKGKIIFVADIWKKIAFLMCFDCFVFDELCYRICQWKLHQEFISYMQPMVDLGEEKPIHVASNELIGLRSSSLVLRFKLTQTYFASGVTVLLRCYVKPIYCTEYNALGETCSPTHHIGLLYKTSNKE